MRYTRRMKRWLHTLSLWLLMLALPLQGIAAAAQSSCTPSQHAAMQGAQGVNGVKGADHHHPVALTDSAAPSQHAQQVAHAGQHGHAAHADQHTHHQPLVADNEAGTVASSMTASALLSAPAPADADADADATSHPLASSCSACALCCVGATAPPSVAVEVAYPGPSLAIIVAPAEFVASHVGAGIERPPRTFFA